MNIDIMIISSSSSSSGCERDSGAVAGEKKRRFSEAQVKSLEVIFEERAKLEPRKKQQVAKDLGLQPRQVAIWFQNKRARWKSKQLERAYTALSAEYDALRSSFDSLLHHKNLLSLQVQRLAEMLASNSQLEKNESSKKLTESSFTGSDREEDQTQILISLSSNAKNSDAKKKLISSSLEGKEHKTKEQIIIERKISASNDTTEPKHFCFQNSSWGSDQLMIGSGCSQWWDFLTYE